jgi:hypothetical protein
MDAQAHAAKTRLLRLNPKPDSEDLAARVKARVAYRQRMFDLAAAWSELHEELDLEFDEWDSLKQVAPEFTRRTGLGLLGGGSDRIVFDLGDGTVLKLPIGTGGIDGNAHECATWHGHNWDVTPERGRELAARWLAPVVQCDTGGEWMVMQKVAPVDEADLPNLDWGSVADNELGELGIADTRGYMQWGRMPDGRVVLVDYASSDG